MRILFMTRKYPPSIGGMELFAHDLYAALSANAELDVELVKWGGSNRALPVVLPYLLVRGFWELLTSTISRRQTIDIVHAQDGVMAPIGYQLAKLFRKPLVVVIHGRDITYASRLYQLWSLPAVRHANLVICISQAAADEARKRGVPEGKIQVIPLAVADTLHGTSDRVQLMKQLQLPADTQLLLTVGRLVKRKGVAWFVANALSDLVAQFPRLIYLVVGEGSERSNIEAAIGQTGLADHVRLLGKASGELYQAAYNGADVFVMPNIIVPGDIEGFGLVTLEASLCELPVVAANTEGIRDAIHDGHNGVLVPVGDVAAFHRAIENFLQNTGHARKFGAKSRQFTLDTSTWNKLAENYIQQYQSLLN
jgi:glycosyltransferase involved in cell wall biosynthesis